MNQSTFDDNQNQTTATKINVQDALLVLESEFKDLSPSEQMSKILDLYPNAAISFSGAEDVVLIDMAYRSRKPFTVFTLDTGRLPKETYQFFDAVRQFYNITIDVCFPEPEAVQNLTTQKGFFSFYVDNHQECCGIRKVAPLKQKLATVDAWVTGQRHDQSPTRSTVPLVQQDVTFGSPEHPLVKFNPLANWSSSDVWSYIRMMEIPYNKLHEQGYISIGCEPCTKSVLPNQHEREGRWWWEENTKKECGLHAGNLK